MSKNVVMLYETALRISECQRVNWRNWHCFDATKDAMSQNLRLNL